MKKNEKKKNSKTQKTEAAAAARQYSIGKVKKKEHHDSDNMKRGERKRITSTVPLREKIRSPRRRIITKKREDVLSLKDR